jgi:uncharacterized membrane protein
MRILLLIPYGLMLAFITKCIIPEILEIFSWTKRKDLEFSMSSALEKAGPLILFTVGIWVLYFCIAFAMFQELKQTPPQLNPETSISGENHPDKIIKM